jgi:PAS domain S-box-containing protein
VAAAEAELRPSSAGSVGRQESHYDDCKSARWREQGCIVLQVNVLACLLSAVAAICIYASVAHLLAARNPWFRRVHLIFAAIAAMAAVHALAHIAVYASHDVSAYLAASHYRNIPGAIVMALLPWLIQGYFGGGSRVVPALLSAFFLLSVGLNEFAPIGSAIRPTPILEQIALPWGETATIHRLSATPIALVVFWTVTGCLLAYVMVLAVRQRQRGTRRQAMAMTAAIAILVLAIVGNILIQTNHLDFVFMAEFGFLALVLIMMRLLSGEESYRAIIAQAHAGIFVASATGRLLEVNRAGSKMLARSRAELRKLSIADLSEGTLQNAPPLDTGDIGEAKHSVHWLRRKDGSTVLADMSTQVLSDGRVLHIACDVTEMQRINAAIRLLAESGPPDDSARFFTGCAHSMAEAFGVRHAFIGTVVPQRNSVRALGQWSSGDTDPSEYRLDAAPCSQLRSTRRSIHLPNASMQFSEHAPFLGRGIAGYLGAAVVSPAQEIIGVVEVWDERPFIAGAESHQMLEMFAHRIGAEIERSASQRALLQLTASLEERIAARTTELAQANEELEAFSYSVSHDLRTPVRAIDAHARLLDEQLGERLDAAARKHLDRIAQAVHRMQELIDGLLTLSRLSHQPLKFEAVDLSALAQQAFELLQERDHARTVEFACEPGVVAHADRTAVSIVLSNLIENAWKYSSRTMAARIQFGQERVGEETRVYVRDNGIGFDMKHAKHLFEPFRRLHSSRDFPGTGVGLATVQRIIKRHNGRIWAHSEREQGTAFYFTLHAAEQPSARDTSGSPRLIENARSLPSPEHGSAARDI